MKRCKQGKMHNIACLVFVWSRQAMHYNGKGMSMQTSGIDCYVTLKEEINAMDLCNNSNYCNWKKKERWKLVSRIQQKKEKQSSGSGGCITLYIDCLCHTLWICFGEWYFFILCDLQCWTKCKICLSDALHISFRHRNLYPSVACWFWVWKGIKKLIKLIFLFMCKLSTFTSYHIIPILSKPSVLFYPVVFFFFLLLDPYSQVHWVHFYGVQQSLPWCCSLRPMGCTFIPVTARCSVVSGNDNVVWWLWHKFVLEGLLLAYGSASSPHYLTIAPGQVTMKYNPVCWGQEAKKDPQGSHSALLHNVWL